MRLHRGRPAVQLVFAVVQPVLVVGSALAGLVVTQPADAVSDGTGPAWISGISLLVAVGARVIGVAHGERLVGSGVRSL
ncbi:hypothetical protein OH799_04045 [Nocardia sp. NBC_00881]|uniref:hypothetical protein n=1 Tax=Nocardia sp. NBC_00881 TaxID=2975995 RepID=UPI0038684445|nr:hypothetical protein OH799_04045 [Nocardia sp. NBC_00881]